MGHTTEPRCSRSNNYSYMWQCDQEEEIERVKVREMRCLKNGIILAKLSHRLSDNNDCSEFGRAPHNETSHRHRV